MKCVQIQYDGYKYDKQQATMCFIKMRKLLF